MGKYNLRRIAQLNDWAIPIYAQEIFTNDLYDKGSDKIKCGEAHLWSPCIAVLTDIDLHCKNFAMMLACSDVSAGGGTRN